MWHCRAKLSGVAGGVCRGRERLGQRLAHFGYLAKTGPMRAAAGASVVCSTAVHEFFGVSILKAMYCGCVPVLPNRLSYPELCLPSSMSALPLR